VADDNGVIDENERPHSIPVTDDRLIRKGASSHYLSAFEGRAIFNRRFQT
jgi:hypothetical protein